MLFRKNDDQELCLFSLDMEIGINIAPLSKILQTLLLDINVTLSSWLRAENTNIRSISLSFKIWVNWGSYDLNFFNIHAMVVLFTLEFICYICNSYEMY